MGAKATLVRAMDGIRDEKSLCVILCLDVLG